MVQGRSASLEAEQHSRCLRAASVGSFHDHHHRGISRMEIQSFWARNIGSQMMARHPANPADERGKSLQVMRLLCITVQMLGFGRQRRKATDTSAVTYPHQRCRRGDQPRIDIGKDSGQVRTDVSHNEAATSQNASRLTAWPKGAHFLLTDDMHSVHSG
jgi:hypothetical protein